MRRRKMRVLMRVRVTKKTESNLHYYVMDWHFVLLIHLTIWVGLGTFIILGFTMKFRIPTGIACVIAFLMQY